MPKAGLANGKLMRLDGPAEEQLSQAHSWTALAQARVRMVAQAAVLERVGGPAVAHQS